MVVVSEPTVQAELASAVAPFAQALASFPRSPDDALWMGTPDYAITVGDLRRLVAAVERANR